MFAIEVVFLTGRYVATAHNTRTAGEWPPHPARLFSAMVATHHASDNVDPVSRLEERRALEWLECLGAPAVSAGDATQRDVVTMFVPVNDVALTDVDREALQHDEAESALAAAVASGDVRTAKSAGAALEKSKATLARAVRRATEVPAKPPSPHYGQRVLPEYRTRQPRTMPSMTPADPRVAYLWPDAEASAEKRTALDGLLARLVRLGHSSSLVAARVADDTGSPTWHPAPDGELALRVVEQGQLESLERAFERHGEFEPRVLPARAQLYARVEDSLAQTAPSSVFSDDWLVLRRVEGPELSMTGVAGVARAVRRTLMSFADEPIAEVLSGHTADGLPTTLPHLAIVPLPFVGHPHASGSILGVALVLPRAATDADRRSVYLAVRRWEDAHRREDEDAPIVPLNLGASGVLRLERVDGSGLQASLRSQTWSRPARTWHSVTPMALDRHPGDLGSRDPDVVTAAVAAAYNAVAVACRRVGLPEPIHVEVLPAAPWAGAAKARQYPRFPEAAERTRRVLTHIRIEFGEPVSGPVLLGAGRFAGLGLFRPESVR